MNYTKEQIKSMIKSLLQDIKRPYFDHMPFDIEFINNEDIYGTNEIIEKAWKTVVYVQEDQFPDKEDFAIIIIIINDNNGEVESYLDTSCGRPIPMKAVLKNGKYELKQIY